MEIRPGLSVDERQLAAFCSQHGIRRLAAFGSVLGQGFDSESDIDLLVEFEARRLPGLVALAAMELELSELFGGREVELRTYEDLSRHFRDQVRASAKPLYDAA
jgi:predicted nucleotidyltransferase